MKEILKQLVETVYLPEDVYLEQDIEILDIFIEEFHDICEQLRLLLADWSSSPEQEQLTVEIRRFFHTLKGSGRMVGAENLAELAWTVEDTLNKVISQKITLTSDLVRYVQTVFNIYIYKYYPDFYLKRNHSLDIRPLILLGQQLQKQQKLNQDLAVLLELSLTLNHQEASTGLELDNFADDLKPESIHNKGEDVQVTSQKTDKTLSISMDSETFSIFMEEVEEHRQTIQDFLVLETPEFEQYNQLIRALHTLKGSSGMAHIDHIFDASAKIEQVFKIFIHEDIEDCNNEKTLLEHFYSFLNDYIFILKTDASMIRLQKIYDNYIEASNDYDFKNILRDDQSNQENIVIELLELNIDDILNVEYECVNKLKYQGKNYIIELLQQVQKIILKSDQKATKGLCDLCRNLEGIHQQLNSLSESLFQKLTNHTKFLNLFIESHQLLTQFFDLLAAGQRVCLTQNDIKPINDLIELIAQLNTEQTQLGEMEAPKSFEINYHTDFSRQISTDKAKIYSSEAIQDFDKDVLEIFIEEADELLIKIENAFGQWSAELENVPVLTELMRYLHTLKGGANMLQATNIGLLAHQLETIYEQAIKRQIPINQNLSAILRIAQDDVADRLALLKSEHRDYPAAGLLHALHDVHRYLDQADVQLEAGLQNPLNIFTNDQQENEQQDSHDLLQQMYCEEAQELIQKALRLLKQWFEQRGNHSLLIELQRAVHTIKGGAKQLGLQAVAEVSYQLERTFEQYALYHFNSNANDVLLENVLLWLRNAIQNKVYEQSEQLKLQLQNIEYVDVSAQLPSDIIRKDISHESASLIHFAEHEIEPPSMYGAWEHHVKSGQSQEMIRVSANLVEKMIDLSGENSISRSRVELDLHQLQSTLSEMELTIFRLADQLRRMEGELESQILAKHNDEVTIYQDFDPLEMDQYSSLNQLSKSLAESASDLIDFKTTLVEKIRDTENLLLQQSRIQNEMQDGLMQTRLVPFSRLLPRLQRLVRQISSSLDRPAELIVNNVDGEFDRNILEKLVVPFEHMLRNAIDHGIEDTDIRLALGKPAVGQIHIDVQRLGTDLVVVFSDDGKGIDVQKIKAKAIKEKLIKSYQKLDHSEIMQLIFNSGLSTAKSLTQISGRGVGLDVVQTEIKRLGGQITVESTPEKGTRFIIQVPTAVATSDALMVRVADQQFAIPLLQIDRIVRVSPQVLEEYFHKAQDYILIEGQKYRLRYLSEFVGHQAVPKLSGIGHSLPVLLIKNSLGQTVALLVDQLMGSSHKIVVKSIGQQFAKHIAISGATILANGQVCLILDCHVLARQIQTMPRSIKTTQDTLHDRNIDQRPLIMIVDDSVTVRKVTTRLLERNGFDVVTAKDGVDAVEQLENIKPDLMLLDIEMPRMDGFEVTSHVRHHEIHENLPIIMITSRTGEKHRERAFSLGVSRYMGKPFQESELLNNIAMMLTVKN
nr:Hpt domain-containing protein [Acinetobacter sp. Marseille-Q1620]